MIKCFSSLLCNYFKYNVYNSKDYWLLSRNPAKLLISVCFYSLDIILVINYFGCELRYGISVHEYRIMILNQAYTRNSTFLGQLPFRVRGSLARVLHLQIVLGIGQRRFSISRVETRGYTPVQCSEFDISTKGTAWIEFSPIKYPSMLLSSYISPTCLSAWWM